MNKLSQFQIFYFLHPTHKRQCERRRRMIYVAGQPSLFQEEKHILALCLHNNDGNRDGNVTIMSCKNLDIISKVHYILQLCKEGYNLVCVLKWEINVCSTRLEKTSVTWKVCLQNNLSQVKLMNAMLVCVCTRNDLLAH